MSKGSPNVGISISLAPQSHRITCMQLTQPLRGIPQTGKFIFLKITKNCGSLICCRYIGHISLLIVHN